MGCLATCDGLLPGCRVGWACRRAGSAWAVPARRHGAWLDWGPQGALPALPALQPTNLDGLVTSQVRLACSRDSVGFARSAKPVGW